MSHSSVFTKPQENGQTASVSTPVPETTSTSPTSTASPQDSPAKHETLTERMRVLLHALPLFELKLSDTRRDPSLRHYDTLVIALQILDVIVDRMGIGGEIESHQLIPFLAPTLSSMDELARLPVVSHRHDQIVQRVLSGLKNETAQGQPFAVPYLDADTSDAVVSRTLKFRLVYDHQLIDGRTVLRLSAEAVNLYLRALEFNLEDEHAAAEAVLLSQLSRGKLVEARKSARVARLQSLRYREKMLRILKETQRDLSRFDWQDEVPLLLTEALSHLEQRLQIEQTILRESRSLREQQTESDETSASLYQIQELMEECRVRHLQLQQQLLQARSVFLSEQERQSFISSQKLFRPDLRNEVLFPLLQMEQATVQTFLKDTVPALVGTVTPSLVSLQQLMAWQLTPVHTHASHEVPLNVVEAEQNVEPETAANAELRRAAETLLEELPSRTSLSDLCRDLENKPDAFTLMETLGLLALEHFGAGEGGEQRRHHIVKGGPLETPHLQGDDLIITPTNLD